MAERRLCGTPAPQKQEEVVGQWELQPDEELGVHQQGTRQALVWTLCGEGRFVIRQRQNRRGFVLEMGFGGVRVKTTRQGTREALVWTLCGAEADSSIVSDRSSRVCFRIGVKVGLGLRQTRQGTRQALVWTLCREGRFVSDRSRVCLRDGV